MGRTRRKTKTGKSTNRQDTEDDEEKESHLFNSGRTTCDNKWLEAIDERIKELEEQVGIPELRRLKKKIKYTWDVKEEEKKIGKWIFKNQEGSG